MDYEHMRVEKKQSYKNLYMKQIMMQKIPQAPFVKALLFATGKKICLSTYPNNWEQILLYDPLNA